jgi:hypothetical protein
VSGVSSGDGYANNTSLGASPYKKTDGQVWNGKCYAYYVNGDVSYCKDSNGNYCDIDGHLFSNNFN